MEKQADGSLIVYGVATDETLDSDQQIVDLGFSKQAMPEWLKWGNVRVMHSTNLYPAGVGMEVDTTGNSVMMKAQIYEPTAVLLVETKTLKAFSVGIADPKVIHDVKARGGRIVGGEIIEVSLVDRPANPNCSFGVIKCDKGGDPVLVSKFSKGADVSDSQEVPEVGKTLDLTDEVKTVEPEAEKEFPPAKEESDAAPAEDEKPAPPAEDGADASPSDDAKPEDAPPSADAGSESESDGIPQDPHADAADEAPKADAPVVNDPDVGGGVDRGQLDPDKDFVFPEDAPEGGFPIVTPQDVQDAVSSWGRYKGDRTLQEFQRALTSLAREKGPSFVAELPDSWSADQAQKEDAAVVPPVDTPDVPPTPDGPPVTKGLSWSMKRFHAALCAAYSADAIKSEYPTIVKDGIASTLGTSVQSSLYAMLLEEVAEDAGTGAEAHDIKHLAEAYGKVVEFLDDENCEIAMSDDLFMAAHDELHGAFKLANIEEPDAPNLTPASPPDPGKFRRPIISAGHARNVAASQNNTAVVNDSDGDTPDPASIDRGLVTDGHERTSAGSKPMATGKGAGENLDPDAATQSPVISGRMFYTNDQKAQAQAAMQAMHDHITALFPTLCPMGDEIMPDMIPREDVAPEDVMDNKGTEPDELVAGKTTEAPAAEGSTVPATKVAGGAVAPVAEDPQEAIVKAVTAAVSKAYDSRIQELEQLVEKMASEPDPAVEPFRGTAGVVGRVAEKVAHKTPDEIQADKSEVADVDTDVLNYYRHVALNGSDPVQQRAAIEKLVSLTGPVKNG